MDQLTVYGVALVPVIIGLSELLKRFGLPTRLVPLAALALGLFFSFFLPCAGGTEKSALFWNYTRSLCNRTFFRRKNMIMSRKK